MLGTSIYNSGTNFYIDDDTKCSCIASAITCKRDTCPVLECPIELQTKTPGRRCPQCPLVEESRAACTYAGKTYNASIFLNFILSTFLFIQLLISKKKISPYFYIFFLLIVIFKLISQLYN